MGLLVQALRPVLLVHVLGAEVSSAAAAAASFDAAGEPTGSPPPPHADEAQQQGSSSEQGEDHRQSQEEEQPGPEMTAEPQGAQPLPHDTPDSGSATKASTAAPVQVLGSRGQVMTRPQLPPPAQQQQQQQQEPQAASNGTPPSMAPAQQPAFVQPPLTPSLTCDLATGCASLAIYTPELAEAVAGWAMQQPRGGLTRFTSKQLCHLLWAFASWRHDRLTLFEGAAEVIATRVLGTNFVSSSSSDGSGPHGRPLQYHDLQKLVWAFSKFNRHPGEDLLQAVQAAWELAGRGQGQGHARQHQEQHHISGTPCLPPLDALCTILYSLAILREHRHPLAVTLAAQLAQHDTGVAPSASQAAAPPPPLHTRPEYLRQARHVAACLLAAQAEHQEAPLLESLTGEAQAAAIRAWQAQVRGKCSVSSSSCACPGCRIQFCAFPITASTLG
jgi:hypothetical protein